MERRVLDPRAVEVGEVNEQFHGTPFNDTLRGTANGDRRNYFGGFCKHQFPNGNGDERNCGGRQHERVYTGFCYDGRNASVSRKYVLDTSGNRRRDCCRCLRRSLAKIRPRRDDPEHGCLAKRR